MMRVLGGTFVRETGERIQATPVLMRVRVICVDRGAVEQHQRLLQSLQDSLHTSPEVINDAI